MNAETEFDLNAAIQRWREDLSRSSALRAENLNELESHLRDSIDTLLARELTDEEVFLIATRRIGGAQKLEQEFGKVNGAAVWFDRCLWVLVAVQLWAFISSASSLLLGITYPILLQLNDVLPGFGLQKIGRDWMRTGPTVIFSPLATAIAIGLIWRYLVWPKRRGSAELQRLLRKPGTLALTLFLACAAVQSAAVWALETWYYPSMYYPVAVPVYGLDMRLLIFRLPVLALWAVLTFFIARKRLRSSPA